MAGTLQGRYTGNSLRKLAALHLESGRGEQWMSVLSSVSLVRGTISGNAIMLI